MAVPYKVVSAGAATFLSPHQRAAEAGQVNVVHVSSFSGNREISNVKAKYGNASRVINVAHSLFVF